jgi:hypothetical protein
MDDPYEALGPITQDVMRAVQAATDELRAGIAATPDNAVALLASFTIEVGTAVAAGLGNLELEVRAYLRDHPVG